MEEVKAQTQVLKKHLEESVTRMERRQIVEFEEKAAFLPVAARGARGHEMRKRNFDGIFAGHHERIGASLFFSERGLLIADQQWANEHIRRPGCPCEDL